MLTPPSHNTGNIALNIIIETYFVANKQRKCEKTHFPLFFGRSMEGAGASISVLTKNK